MQCGHTDLGIEKAELYLAVRSQYIQSGTIPAAQPSALTYQDQHFPKFMYFKPGSTEGQLYNGAVTKYLGTRGRCLN